MDIYKIENQVFPGPYETDLKIVKNTFSLKDILNPDMIKMISKDYDITKTLTKFYYRCDCQCFYCFKSEDDSTSIFIYADTNIWEAIYITTDNKRITFDCINGKTMKEKEHDCTNTTRYSLINQKIHQITDENIQVIDWKWLEDMEMSIATAS